MFFNVIRLDPTEQLISEYRSCLETSPSATCNFLFKNRQSIKQLLGPTALNEMALNHRALFSRDQKDKILRGYKKYIMSKPTMHKSDYAIGYNIVKYVNVDKKEEAIVVDYLFNQLSASIVKETSYLNKLSSVYFIKKHLVLNHLQDNFLTRI
jgi:hypothetical protein